MTDKSENVAQATATEDNDEEDVAGQTITTTTTTSTTAATTTTAAVPDTTAVAAIEVSDEKEDMIPEELLRDDNDDDVTWPLVSSQSDSDSSPDVDWFMPDKSPDPPVAPRRAGFVSMSQWDKAFPDPQ